MKIKSRKIGNLKQQQETMRGWLVGQFFPENSPFNDSNIEIYHKTLTKDGFQDKLHYHPIGKEYCIVLEGALSLQIDSDRIELKKGEYFAMPTGAKDKILDFEEKTVILGIRYPSIPDNKVLLE